MSSAIHTNLTAKAVTLELQKLGTVKKAKVSAWFFKTQKGQYGYGDVFYGVTVPQQREISKRYQALSLSELLILLKSKVHECRLTALLILVGQYRQADEGVRHRIVNFYLKHRARINNWDLVDASASYILGVHLLGKDRSILYKLANSKNLWDKRIAIITTAAFIRAGEYTDTLAIAKILLADKHDLIHKAAGWMLREVGKKSLVAEEKFLDVYAAIMPRTMLRYAIEKIPEEKRKIYLGRRQDKTQKK